MKQCLASANCADYTLSGSLKQSFFSQWVLLEKRSITNNKYNKYWE